MGIEASKPALLRQQIVAGNNCMGEIPSVIFHFHQPMADERVKITLTTVSGENETALIKLPFPLTLVPLLLRALNARQYPDYQTHRRFFRLEDDRAKIVAALLSLNLWEGSIESGMLPIDIHAQIGRILGASLFADHIVVRCLDTLYNVAIQDGGEIIFKFDLDAMVLAALPWEVTHNNRQPLLLTRGKVLSCSRVTSILNPLPPPRPQGERLRVLALAPHAGFSKPIFRDFEKRARQHLKDQLNGLAVDIEYLSPVTMVDLQERLDRGLPIDVLDYYGHGRFNDGTGALLLDGLQGTEDWVEASRLATLPNLPRMVMLHACQSAQEDIANPHASVAATLSYAGVQAVVAMQLTTRMTAATDAIVPTIYRKLATGWSIQRAVAAARQALYASEPDGASWYLPTLHLRLQELQELQAMRLIEVPPLPPNPFAGMGALGNPTQIIGRKEQQRRMWERLRRLGNLTILGPALSGKTTLLNLIAVEARTHVAPDVVVISITLYEDIKRIEIERELVGMLGVGKSLPLKRLLQGRHLIILLEDLGRLNRDNRGLDVRQWLRGLSQDRTRGVVQLVASSQRPLHDIFVEDRPVDLSPLHEVMRDFIHVDAFTEIEARRFIASHLQDTPFREYDFEPLLKKSLMPGLLEIACRELYDTLSQQMEQS